MNGEMGCDQVRDLAADLAIGIADGQQRDAALRHAATCPSCRRLVAELSSAVDDLLLLAPSHEPPPDSPRRPWPASPRQRPTAGPPGPAPSSSRRGAGGCPAWRWPRRSSPPWPWEPGPSTRAPPPTGGWPPVTGPSWPKATARSSPPRRFMGPPGQLAPCSDT